MFKSFEEVVVSQFPEIVEAGTITRRQAQDIQKDFGVKWPHHIINMNNSVGRGVFKFSADMDLDIPLVPVIEETDDELEIRITETYQTLETLVEAVSANTVNSLIVAGAPGLGKSHDTNSVLNRVNGGGYGYTFHRGYLKATHLFRLLWENRLPGQTIVIDDCDAIFSDETALNMLKAALELKETRTVAWGSEKEFIDQDGEVIPRYFDYQGNIVFLTNLNFSEMASGTSKNSPHLAALESRSLVLDLKVRTKREIMMKIKLTVRSGMLRNKGLDSTGETSIIEFVDSNKDRMKDLSLRSVEKLAALYKLDKSNWEKMARTLMLK
jgi:hypothetical protein